MGHSAGIREQQLRKRAADPAPKYGQTRRFNHGHEQIASDQVVEGLHLNRVGQITSVSERIGSEGARFEKQAVSSRVNGTVSARPVRLGALQDEF